MTAGVTFGDLMLFNPLSWILMGSKYEIGNDSCWSSQFTAPDAVDLGFFALTEFLFYFR